LDKKRFFSSESDLESYIIFSLKKIDSEEYENINKLLGKYRNNQLRSSNVHNQFIFGNAYPSDIAILNKNNINVLELKKDKLSNSIILQIEKEIKKHLCYSLFSHRIESKNIERFNFYLIFLRDKDNNQFKQIIFEKYNNLCKQLDALRENNITFVEYYVKDSILYLEEV
jgi:predicted Zn-dependent protease with MMP-like domain